MNLSNDCYPSRVSSREKIIRRTAPVIYPSDEGPPEHLGNSLLQQYLEKGYMLIPDLFNAQEVATFLEALFEFQTAM